MDIGNAQNSIKALEENDMQVMKGINGDSEVHNRSIVLFLLKHLQVKIWLIKEGK
jgi:hypothetical protein